MQEYTSKENVAKKVIVHAYGDGNCAFNAFALGLCDLIMRGKLDAASDNQKFKIFELFDHSFKEIEIEIEIKPFNQLREFLATFNNREKLIELQKALSTKLRKNAGEIQRVAQKSENELCHDAFQGLPSAYDDYVKTGLSMETGDDMFRRHSFILEEFGKIKKENLTEEATIERLRTWWNKEGFQKFNSAMEITTVYAGDMELGALAKYYEIDALITRGTQMEMSLVQEKDKMNEHIPIFSLRNNDIHWNYEAEVRPEWLASLIMDDTQPNKKQDTKNPTNLSTPAPKASNPIGKWAKEEVRKLLDKIPSFQNKQIEIKEKDDGSFSFKHKTDDINIVRNSSEHEVTTNSRDPEVLLKSVDVLAEIVNELNGEGKNLDRIVSISESDAGTRKMLIKACFDRRLKVKGEQNPNENVDDNPNKNTHGMNYK